MKITTPGYYDIDLATYLSYPTELPALSSKIFDRIITDSPLHARMMHPKLGGPPSDPSPRADIGSAVHALVNGGYPLVYLDFKDWRTDAAKAKRDECRERFEIPILRKDEMVVEQAAASAKMALAQFGAGRFEQSMFFTIDTPSGQVWAQSRTDYINDEYDIDLVTADRANPHHWVKHVAPHGKKQQAALRSVGHAALGQPRKMVWLVQELDAPYANCFIGVSPAMLAIQTAYVHYAANTWAKCLRQGFPGYGSEIHWAEPEGYDAKTLAERTGMVVT